MKGIWKRLVGEVNRGDTTQTEDMIESQWRIGAKIGVQQLGSEEEYKEEGVGKRIKSTSSIDDQNSPKVGVASLKWPQSNQ